MRGYFEIGIWNGKTAVNVGTLWRSAYQLGASGMFTIGKRYPKQASDTVKAYLHIPLREYLTIDEYFAVRPAGARIIAVETGGQALSNFVHPEQAIYLLGAEDHELPPSILALCNTTLSIESIRTESYNVAVAGSIVMYHRLMQFKDKAGAGEQ